MSQTRFGLCIHLVFKTNNNYKLNNKSRISGFFKSSVKI